MIRAMRTLWTPDFAVSTICRRRVTNARTYSSWARTWSQWKTLQTGPPLKSTTKRTRISAPSSRKSTRFNHHLSTRTTSTALMRRRVRGALRIWEERRSPLKECRKQGRGKTRSNTFRPLGSLSRIAMSLHNLHKLFNQHKSRQSPNLHMLNPKF